MVFVRPGEWLRRRGRDHLRGERDRPASARWKCSQGLRLSSVLSIEVMKVSQKSNVTSLILLSASSNLRMRMFGPSTMIDGAIPRGGSIL
jgi:hypothetical protein